MDRIAGRFARVEPRLRAKRLVLGLLSDLPRKNCWTIAEWAGEATPHGMQHLLSGPPGMPRPSVTTCASTSSSTSTTRPLCVEVRDRLQGRTCAWCTTYVPYSGRGRPPRYCSKSCRNRAWEVRTAERRLQRDIAAAAVRAEPVREVRTEPVREVRTETVTRTLTRVQTRSERRPPNTVLT